MNFTVPTHHHASLRNRDQRLYRQALYPTPGPPEGVTPEGSTLRFADGVEDAPRARVVCVVEDHSAQGKEASNYIAAVGMHACVEIDCMVVDRVLSPVLYLYCLSTDSHCSRTRCTDVNTGAVTPLAQGCDFYSSPRLSPDGSKLCWIQWNHPVGHDDWTHSV